ncbi:MAG: branched-chain amino acid ABC transporter permease [Actinomycetes bacterium]
MHAVYLADTFSLQQNLLQPLLDGIFQGAAYGLLGLGLVLLYKSNRIFNFAQGEFATVAAMTTLVFDQGSKLDLFGIDLPNLPYFVAAALGLLAAVGVAMATERVVIRPMFNRPRVVLVVGTIGVTLLLIGVEGLLYPHAEALRPLSEVLGFHHDYLARIDKIAIDFQDVVKLIALAVLALAAYLFFKRTRTGTGILAVSQDTTAARLVGISIERISMVTWALAGLLGGLAGIMLAVPPIVVQPGIFTGVTLTAAFTAAVVGGFTSLPGAFVGGLAVGIVQSFAAADSSFVPGLRSLVSGQAEVAVFVVLLAVLLVRPRGLLGKAT